MCRTLLIAAAIVLGGERAYAVFIDLRGLPDPPTSTSAGGITLTWNPGQPGNFVSTATRFGFNAAGAGDEAALIDGGSGTAERVEFLFGTPVYIDSIVVSQFGAGDAGTFAVTGTGLITLTNGVNTLTNVIAGAQSPNTVSWTGANSAGLGFSVDGFNVRPVAPFSADFDFDGDQDGADLLTWQRNVGITAPPVASPAQGNANFDDQVSGLDLQVWQMQFGAPAEALAVPEPAAAALMLLAATFLTVNSSKEAAKRVSGRAGWDASGTNPRGARRRRCRIPGRGGAA